MPLEPVDVGEAGEPAVRSTLPPTTQRRCCGVHAIHEDVIFTRAIAKAVRAELADLASWLGLAAVEPIL
jgi:hypothetical protein